MTKPTVPKNRPHPLTVALLLASAAVLTFGTRAKHMHPDEMLSFTNMQYDFVRSMELLLTQNNQAPLWWMNIWAWQRTAGFTEFAGRYNGILLSMLTLALAYVMGRDWFRGRAYGWLAVFTLATNAYFFIYALELRMYPLVMLTTTLSMFCFYRWTQHQEQAQALLYGASAALMLYVHYYTAFVVIIQVVYFLVFYSRAPRLWRQGAGAGGLALLLWLPGMVVLWGQLRLIDFAEAGGLKIPLEPANLETALELAQLTTNGLWPVIVLVLAVGAWRLRHRRAYWLALLWWVGGAGLVMALNTQISVYTHRYVAWVGPGAGLSMAAALGALPARLRPVVITGVFGAGLFTGLTGWNAPCQALDNIEPRCAFGRVGMTEYIQRGVPYRPVLAELTRQYQPGDVIYTPQPSDFIDDQLQRYLPAAVLQTRVRSAQGALAAERVWFIHDQLNEGILAAFHEVEASHRLMQIIGGEDFMAQLLVAPPLSDPAVFGGALAFWGAEITPHGQTVEARLWWAVPGSPDLDYAIALHLLGPDGSVLAQVDQQITPPGAAGPIPTSTLDPGGYYLDLRQLALPTGLEPGTYPLHVIVYQWWDGQRLLLENGADHYALAPLEIKRHP